MDHSGGDSPWDDPQKFGENLKPTVSLDGRRWLKQLVSGLLLKLRASVSDAFFVWKGEWI